MFGTRLAHPILYNFTIRVLRYASSGSLAATCTLAMTTPRRVNAAIPSPN